MVSDVCVHKCVYVHVKMVVTTVINCVYVCASGQWKVKFEQKPKKGLFTKLNGDLVKVPLLYHQKYMMTMTYIVGLKAQVTDD